MIFAEGSDADAFDIVTKGMVEIVLPRPGNRMPSLYNLDLENTSADGFLHDRRSRASVRASEAGPVEVLAIGYDQFGELLNQSEATREMLHQYADGAKRRTSCREGWQHEQPLEKSLG